MSKDTEEKNIRDNLKYIGLDLDNIPQILKQEYNIKTFKFYENKTCKIYKYVPISKIKILLTSANRLESINKRYSKASSIYSYLEPQREDDIVKHAIFLKMLKDMNITEIKKIDEEQRKLKRNIPFKVTYSDNYMWQVFYSEEDDQYIALFSIEDTNTSAFFYLLRQQVKYFENGKENNIFVPILNLEYSRNFLKKTEILDIEKYLWLFTKEWPFTYEVYNINGENSIQIVGSANVYEKIKSYYKVILNSKEEASKFYKLIKALFILQTELPYYYNFETKISSDGGLEFFCNSKLITYDNLSKMITSEYKKALDDIKIRKIEKDNAEKKLKELNVLFVKNNQEYRILEKRVTTYLECRKTFLGKVKYFFRSRKKEKIKFLNNNTENEKINTLENEDTNIIKDKEFYTIEDLLIVVKKLNSLNNELKNIKLDTEALQYRNDNINLKIENANKYMNEIENHKKSIFEFWKFANRDQNLALNPGGEAEQNIKNRNIKKTFDYKDDIEEIGIQFDKYQRKTLTKEDCNSIYIATTNILTELNRIKQGDTKEIEKSLELLKAEANKENLLFNSEEFDIFGSITEDRTKIKTLGNVKHRENKKDKIQILDITKNITVEEYYDVLKKIVNQINECFSKLESVMDINLYMASDNILNTDEWGVFTIDPEDSISKVKDFNKFNLYRIHIKEKMPIIAFSNIIYYDNLNGTLPIGMNTTNEMMIDMSMYNFELKRQKLFRINQEIDDIISHIKIICVYEYDLELKRREI